MNCARLFLLIYLLAAVAPLRLSAEAIGIQQNSKINIVNIARDGGSANKVQVKQGGETNIVINSRTNGSQELDVAQTGLVNFVHSRQISLSPGEKSVNITIVSQSNGVSSAPFDGLGYVDTAIGEGYLREFMDGQISIANFGPFGSVSDIGRSR